MSAVAALNCRKDVDVLIWLKPQNPVVLRFTVLAFFPQRRSIMQPLKQQIPLRRPTFQNVARQRGCARRRKRFPH